MVRNQTKGNSTKKRQAALAGGQDLPVGSISGPGPTAKIVHRRSPCPGLSRIERFST
jgi:hypothetical protein